jgi:hypothetical protein
VGRRGVMPTYETTTTVTMSGNRRTNDDEFKILPLLTSPYASEAAKQVQVPYCSIHCATTTVVQYSPKWNTILEYV